MNAALCAALLFAPAAPPKSPWAVPFDPELAAKRRAAQEAWARDGTLAVFDRSAAAKEPWAPAARAVFAAFARRQGQFNTRGGVAHQEFLAALEAAEKVGVRDPLINYWQSKTLAPFRAAEAWAEADPKAAVEGFRRAAKDIPGTAYHPVWKMHAAWNGLVGLRFLADKPGVTLEPAELKAAEAAFWEAFRRAAADPHPLAQENVAEIAVLLIGDRHDRLADRAAGWRDVDDAFAAAGASEWLRLCVEGDFLIAYAWDARGSGAGASVTGDGWRRFEERLRGAEECFEAAWALNSSRAEPAAAMVTVAMGRGTERRLMERWFRRAMEADPDCRRACSAKREYVQPKWHGSETDPVDFARECRATKNYLGGVAAVGENPFSVLVATADDAANYYRNQWAWEAAREAWEGHLADLPADRDVRTRYAWAAACAGRWADAKKQFAALGDKPWPGYFASRAEYERLRDRANAEGGAVP